MTKHIMIVGQGGIGAAIASLLGGPREYFKHYGLESSVVPQAGIEPALLSEPHFECGASTSSAIGATKTDERGLYHGLTRSDKPLSDEEVMAEIESSVFDRCNCEGCSTAPLEGDIITDTLPLYTQYDVMEQDLRVKVRAVEKMTDEQCRFADRLVNLYNNLTLPGSLDVVFKFDTRGFFYAQIVDLEGEDNVTGEPLVWHGRKWFLSPHKKDNEIVTTVFKALMTALEHEVREQFLYKDVAILNPHFDLEKMVEFHRQEGSKEYRS